MRKLDINVLFPYNWYHARRVKIYDDKGNPLTKIGHCEYQQLEIDDDVKHLVIKIDLYKSIVDVPQDEEQLNLAIYLNFRNSFPHMYIDTFKRDFICGSFMSDEEFRNFNLAFYNRDKKLKDKAKVDFPAMVLGSILACGLIVMSVVEQENPSQDLVFFIGIASLISLIMIWLDKANLYLFDYKSRMIASGMAFILGAFFLDNAFPVASVIVIFSLAFLLRLYNSLNTIGAAKSNI